MTAVKVRIQPCRGEKSLHPGGEASVVDEALLGIAEGGGIWVGMHSIEQVLNVSEQIKTLVSVFWYRDASVVFSILVCLAKTNININFPTSFINSNVFPCQYFCKVRLFIFRNNICFSEQTVECCQECAP